MNEVPTYQLTVVSADKVAKMDSIASGYSAALAVNENLFGRSFITAQAMQQLRESLTPDVMKPMMELMNSDLGFLTDKDPKRPRWNSQTNRMEIVEAYSVDVVRDCLIVGMLQGLAPIGNQINIISGRCYIPKNGISVMLKRVPGFSNLVISYGLPKLATNGEGAIVPVAASWKINGQPQKLSGADGKDIIEIPVKVNKQMGADAILGKAERKAKARVYAQITGSEIADGDIDDTLVGSARPVGPGLTAPALGTAFDTFAQAPASKPSVNLEALGGKATLVRGEPLPNPEPTYAEDHLAGDPVGAPAESPAPAANAESVTAPVPAPAEAPAEAPTASPAGGKLAEQVIALMKRDGVSGAKFMDFAIRQSFAEKGAQSPFDISEKNLSKIITAWGSVSGICGGKKA